MNTCKDCKYWEGSVYGSDVISAGMDFACDKNDHLGRTCFYAYSDRHEQIRTGPDFGCIHWEQK